MVQGGKLDPENVSQLLLLAGTDIVDVVRDADQCAGFVNCRAHVNIKVPLPVSAVLKCTAVGNTAQVGQQVAVFLCFGPFMYCSLESGTSGLA